MHAPDANQIAALLHAADLPPTGYELAPMPGGANNRVFRLATNAGVFLLKAYFRHPADPRDRLRAEYGFCRYCHETGIQWTPRPLARDTDAGLALYEFIAGRRITPDEVTQTPAIDDALAFYTALNAHAQSAGARDLPPASEACFTMADHVECIGRRVKRLLDIEPSDDTARAARTFVTGRLAPLWDRVSAGIQAGVRHKAMDLHAALPEPARCLSPSDFGFHNALLTPDGHFRFIDFEYAGWDDPAKTVCDFFCQPAIPAPMACFPEFSARLAACHADADACRHRIDLLLPAYQIKWCCIMLNDFLPVESARRDFAQTAKAGAGRRLEQLNRAILLTINISRNEKQFI